MTELLKVFKFILKRAKKRTLKSLSHVKMYKGLYAFLGGITVFSFCFAGKGSTVFAYNGSFAALSMVAAEGAAYLSEYSENTEEQPVPLSDTGALLSLSETEGKKAQRVPYNVFPVSYAVFNETEEASALGAIEGAAEANISVQYAEIAPENENEELNEEENSEIAPEEENEEKNGEEISEIVPEEKKEEVNADKISETISEEENEKSVSEWQAVSGIKYVNTDLIYSRAEAVEGSEKINRYRINDAVEVEALTDTHYYKLKSGEFIHEDYLSDEESPKWTEAPADGVMYVKNGGIYSRKEALEGAEKINKYNLNDTVTVLALTNTGYYKIGENEFIHSDFLSPEEVVDYPLSTQYGQRAQTASEQNLSQQVFDTVNAVRAEYGLAPFKQLDSLNAAANERAWETTFYNSHTRPDGTKCFTVLDEYGLKNSSTKAENIAKWYSSAQAVVNAWMSDYAHRSAILGDHEYMGVGCYYISGDYYGYYWSQVFYTP